jgi:fructose-1,6-bisphosphatase/inositol monophosphatase family enzyme
VIAGVHHAPYASLVFYGQKGERKPNDHGRNRKYDERDLHVSSAATFQEAFAKLRKVTTSFLMAFRPSVRMEHIGSRWADFQGIW